MTQKTVSHAVSTRVNRRRRLPTSNGSVNGGESGMYMYSLVLFDAAFVS